MIPAWLIATTGRASAGVVPSKVVEHNAPPDAESPRKEPSASRRVQRFGLQTLGRELYKYMLKSLSTPIHLKQETQNPLFFLLDVIP